MHEIFFTDSELAVMKTAIAAAIVKQQLEAFAAGKSQPEETTTLQNVLKKICIETECF